MWKIQARPIDAQSFAPFGRCIDLLDPGGDPGRSAYFPDLLQLQVPQPTSVSVGRVCACRRRLPFIESHPGTAEVRLPLDGDIVLYVAPVQPLEQLDPESIQAFVVPQGTLVELEPGILHGRQFTVDKPMVHVMFLCRDRASRQDTRSRTFEENINIEIVLNARRG